MIIPQVFYNILLLASIPAAVAACIAGVFLLRKGWRAGAVLCGLVMLAGVLGFLLPLNGVLVGDGMVNGLSYQGKRLTARQVEQLSDETLDWLARINRLSPEEQMAISCCPADLIEVLELDEEDAPAED